jgi:zinc and cadmium transporter
MECDRVHPAALAPPVVSTLTEIVVAALAGGVLATIAAAGTLALHPSWISRLVSFAVGALLGAVFLELLPHALETGSAERVMGTVLVGLLALYVAVADLIPSLHRRPEPVETAKQLALIALGIAVIAIAHVALEP